MSTVIPEVMKGVLLVGHGGFDKLEYREDIPVPRPAAGEVLIRVAATGVNNTDINTRIGWYSKAVKAGTEGGAVEARPFPSAICAACSKVVISWP